MKKAKYISIGYSAGAIGMIDALRRKDPDGKILTITGEPFRAYGRPAIVDYAMGKINRNGILYQGESFTEKNNVESLTNTMVESIDSKSKILKCSDDTEVSYEHLLINTGGKPISPPIPGKELDGVMHFFNLSEADSMIDRVKNRGANKAVVIGGGLIGLKATEALVHLGVKVTMVELAPSILSRALDPKSSALMTRKMIQNGVDIRTGVSVETILGDGKVEKVQLTDGNVIDTDMVYISIGVFPNTGLAEQAGIQCNRGIELNLNMQTNLPDIYAAGDAAKGYNFLNHENMVIAIWPVARKMGYYAGLNMLGLNTEYDGSIPMNSLYFEDLYTISYGESNPRNPDDYEMIEVEFSENNFRKFIIKDNRLVGAVYVGDISRAGVAKSMIYQKVPVNTVKDKLLKEDFAFVDLPKSFRKAVFDVPFQELEAKEA